MFRQKKFAQSTILCLIAISIVCVPGSFAQSYIDLLRIEYAASMGNDFKTESGTSAVQELEVDITVPVQLSEKRNFITGFLFEHTTMRPYAEQPSVSVSTLNLKLGLNSRYSETWSVTYLVLPKVSSDLKKITGRDLQIGVAALFKYSKNKNLNFKFGAFYNTDLFGPFISPLFGVYYLHKKWEYNILIPRLLDINYQLAKSLKVGLRFNGSIKSFNLNTTANGKSQYLAKSNNEIGGYLNWSMGRLNLIGMLGHSIGRSYRTYERNDQLSAAISAIKLGDERSQLNSDFKDGVVFKFSLLYRFQLEN